VLQAIQFGQLGLGKKEGEAERQNREVWVATQTSHTPAHDVTTTVAPFRAWRGSQLIIARGPARVTIKNGSVKTEGANYQGFAPVLQGRLHTLRKP